MGSPAEVVVSGIGGIFPNCLDLNDFKELLLKNANTATQAKRIQSELDGIAMYNSIPLNRAKAFDATFFGIHRNQVEHLDPQTHMFLEKTFEAIIDAGVNPADIRGKTIPVIMCATLSEADKILYENISTAFTLLGTAKCMMANRVSYWLNVNGPSCTTEVNWNGGIQVLQTAKTMIESGICDSAVVGAVIFSDSKVAHELMKVRNLLSQDGFTRPFDEQADGYSRGEGVVVLYLQRADLAKRNYCSVLHASSIFNGSHQGDFIGCDSDMFRSYLQQCYADSNIDPRHVSYLETYGCGLKNIDEAELAAVEQVFCKDRDTPLQIGSVKTNIGHTEPVSALMSLIKIIVAMETGIIPAHLNYNQPNKNIPALTNGKLEVVTKNKEWTGDLAAINCIGIGSSYGHMIVRRNKQPKVDIKTDLPLLLTYSTRTEEGIQQISDNVQLTDFYYNNLVHEVFSSNIPGHLYRGYSMKASADKTGFQHYSGNKRPVWFVYSGMGSQWQTMGRDLMKLPIFAEAVYKCHNTLKPKGIDLVSIITNDDPQIFENILNSFVAIAAVQIGLTDVLNAIGIQPDGIIGHSTGELGCAYADKCLTAEQTILSAYYRGKASLAVDMPVGMMAAIGLGNLQLISMCPPSIDIACHNSANSCTISGPADDVSKFVKILGSKDIFNRLVNVSNIAYHSRYVKPVVPHLLAYLKNVIPEPKARSSKWVSTSVPVSKWETELARTVSPEYLTNNLLSPVLFEEGLPFIPNDAVAIEIAPHGLLQAILKRALPLEVVNVPLTKRGTNCLEFLFNSLGQLYLSGLNFNLNPLYPAVPMPVPSGTSSLCSLAKFAHGDEWELDGTESAFNATERTFDINLKAKEFKQLKYYTIDSRIFVPPALYFGFIHEMMNRDGKVKSITFEDVVFQNHIEIPQLGTISLTIMIEIGTGKFEVHSEEHTLVTGTVVKNNNETLPPAQVQNYKDIEKINENNFYKELCIKGYTFQNEYKLVSSVNLKENGFEASISYPRNWTEYITALLQTHLFHAAEGKQNILLPKYIQRLNISFDDLKENGKESTVWFNKKTNILESNKGVHITGVQYEPTMTVNNSVKLENLNFIKHIDENIQAIEYGLNMFTKIVTENVGIENLVITELKDNYTTKYLPYIEKYLNQKNLNVKMTEINDLDYTELQESSLTIVSGKFLNVMSYINFNENNFFILCFPSSHCICMSNKYTTIAQFSAQNNKFYLLKKTNVSQVKIINVKDNKLSYKNMQTNSIPWTSELKTMSRDENSRIYLVSRTIPVEGIQEFVTKLQHLVKNGKNLRFIFILDISAPECQPEAEFYARVFEQDLIVNVFKNGTWGSYVNVSETSEISKINTYNSILRAVNSNDLLSECQVQYLGLHTQDLTRIDDAAVPCHVGALGFAGTRSSGDRVMGFAQSDLDHCKLATDSAFVWPVPQHWSLCDAATVPYAYTLAYYTLFTVGNLSKTDVVLVHAGCSEVGQAALHVAFNYGCTVFTTVANDQQKVILQKLMPKINVDNILNSESTQFELDILQKTRGRPVDVILNCLPGQRLQASQHLMAFYSRFIQLGSADLHEYASIGTIGFLRCCSFHGVSGQHLLQLDNEIKQQLHEMVSQGIHSAEVVPIRRRIFTENRVDDCLRYLRSSAVMGAAVMQVNNVNNEKPRAVSNSFTPTIQKQDSYLIYADSQDTWVSLTEWLVKHGAKRIIIANHANQNQDFIRRFLLNIKQNYDTEIIITKHNANSLENAKSLANEVRLIGCVKELFIFATDGEEYNYKIFENIDVAFCQNKQTGRMVCILGTNQENSYVRTNRLPICNIMWDNIYSLQDVIKNLDVILTNEDETNVFIKSDLVGSAETNGGVDTTEDNSLFLPTSLKTLKLLGQNELEVPTIVQLNSLASKRLRELLPVFLVPGLFGPHCPNLRQFVGQLMYPVFCVNLPATTLQDDIVAHLAQQIIQVRECEVYKLIGVSWGGILAIEIAKQLEKIGKKIDLQLINGDPQDIQNFTNNFNKNGTFNTALLKQNIKVDGKCLENLLTPTNFSQSEYKDIVKSLTVLKNLIEYSNCYKPLPNQIIGLTTVILPESADMEESLILEKHCKQIQYRVFRENQHPILANKCVIDIVNDNLS